MERYLVDILVFVLSVHRDADLCSHHLQLLDGSRAIDVARHQHRVFVLLGLEHIGQLTAERGLTRTLQSGHQDNGRFSRQMQLGGFTTHQLGQFIVHDLNHELPRLHSRQHVHTQCLCLHRVGEVLGHFIVDVGVQKSAANILEGFRHVDLGDLAFTFQYLERAFQAFT